VDHRHHKRLQNLQSGTSSRRATSTIKGVTLLFSTDASDIGALLEQASNNQHTPLAFSSKKLSDTQKKYSTYDRELLAIYESIKYFRDILQGRLITDRSQAANTCIQPTLRQNFTVTSTTTRPNRAVYNKNHTRCRRKEHSSGYIIPHQRCPNASHNHYKRASHRTSQRRTTTTALTK